MEQLKGRDLLSIADLSRDEILGLLQRAQSYKVTGGKTGSCQGKTLGLLFRKASTRTRVSFTVAMYHLGGQVIDLDPNVTQVSRGEPIADTARVLDRYVDILAIRTFAQEEVATFAHYCRIPVINALTDREHPCQILADLLTIQENFPTMQDVNVAYLGDGNNVAHSLLLACAIVGINIRLACPPQFSPLPEIVELAQSYAEGTEITITTDPRAAAKGAHVLYTDVWASMGKEQEQNDRMPIFMPYQLNESLLELATADCIVLHCLPAHRGEEITATVLEGSHSRVWDQAENRMHVQKALIASLL
ncbi:MAG: ornithine carbamoyltransferase [Pseudanabaenaceae cyanobacterium SKYGB_i_bin29]|nr:ornithine carbamoyltransferase [Pseudanabaenaceae cyanobacterium SKYG29]MDW8421998.1 ornithine carbamoyltransferase [Pseudanabaenaceae cyanobacterium SKYGB_i_bin29]